MRVVFGKAPAPWMELHPVARRLPVEDWTRHDGALLLRYWASGFETRGVAYTRYTRLAQHLEEDFTIEVIDG
jgi:hypothetical protein